MNDTKVTSLDITWRDPTFIVPLFCLFPLMGVTDSLTASVALAVIMTIILTVTSLLVWALAPRHKPFFIPALLSITLISVIELLMHAWCYALYRKLGLYLPLCAMGSLLLMRAELVDETHSLSQQLLRSLRMSGGFALAALVLGSGRELIGHGSLFADAPELLGAWAKPLIMQWFDPALGFVLGVLAPGAFVALGLGVALYNQGLLVWRGHVQSVHSSTPDP